MENRKNRKNGIYGAEYFCLHYMAVWEKDFVLNCTNN